MTSNPDPVPPSVGSSMTEMLAEKDQKWWLYSNCEWWLDTGSCVPSIWTQVVKLVLVQHGNGVQLLREWVRESLSYSFFVYYIVMRGFRTCFCNRKLTSIVVNSHPCHSTAVFTRGDTEYLEFSTYVNCVLVTISIDCEPRAIHFRRTFNYWKWWWNGCIGKIVAKS